MPLHVHRFGPPDGWPLVALHGLKGPGYLDGSLVERDCGHHIDLERPAETARLIRGYLDSDP